MEFIAGSTQFDATVPSGFKVNATVVSHMDTADGNYPQANVSGQLNYSASESPVNTSGTLPGSYLTTPSGNYKVYMDSQQNIISGAAQ